MKTLILSLLFSVSSFAGTIIPFERDVTRIPRASYMTSNNHQSAFYTETFLGDEEEKEYFYSFGIMNLGNNEIVPTTATDFDFAYRDFDFVTEDRSRRDTFIWITDYIGTGRVSDMFETAIFFLPRKTQMNIEETSEELIVTLVTGEEVVFSKEAKTIKSGVLSEKAMDFNPNRLERKFAGISYSGTGMMIRSDARASDPRLAKNVTITKSGLKDCVVAAKNFWTQEGFPKFQFITDEEAYKKVADLCGEDYIK